MVEMLIDACEDGEVSKKEKADLEASGQQGLRFRVQDLGFITQVLILTATICYCLSLLLAPSACNGAKSASSPEPIFVGPRNISRTFQGLEVREVLVSSAFLSVRKMFGQRPATGGYVC